MQQGEGHRATNKHGQDDTALAWADVISLIAKTGPAERSTRCAILDVHVEAVVAISLQVISNLSTPLYGRVTARTKAVGIGASVSSFKRAASLTATLV